MKINDYCDLNKLGITKFGYIKHKSFKTKTFILKDECHCKTCHYKDMKCLSKQDKTKIQANLCPKIQENISADIPSWHAVVGNECLHNGLTYRRAL